MEQSQEQSQLETLTMNYHQHHSMIAESPSRNMQVPLLKTVSEISITSDSDDHGTGYDTAVDYSDMFSRIDDDDSNDEGDGERITGRRAPAVGTTASACFNMLSTMVDGGSLSLPYAFAKSGNALMGPILLCLVATLMEYSSSLLIQTAT